MAVNNNGNLLDSSGNVFVDYVWGNFAPQPNDERADGTPTATTTYGAAQNVQWTTKSTIASARLNPALGNHADLEAEWSGYPSFTANSTGKKSGGVYYISVPAVLGLTTALALDALKDAGYEAGSITTASAAANVGKDITRFDAASSTVAYVFGTYFDSTYPVGSKVTITAGTGVPAYAIGTWTVTGAESGNQITIGGSGFTVANTTSISGTKTIAGAAGTIKTQSTAANANTISTTATITVTPWAAAS